MHQAPNNDVRLLFAEAPGWRVAVDSTVVTRVERPPVEIPTLELADLLGGRRIEGLRRVLVAETRNGERGLEVERVLDSRRLATSAVHRVPGVLARLGAPSWWVGLSWSDERPVLILDLCLALEEGGRHDDV